MKKTKPQCVEEETVTKAVTPSMSLRLPDGGAIRIVDPEEGRESESPSGAKQVWRVTSPVDPEVRKSGRKRKLKVSDTNSDSETEGRPSTSKVERKIYGELDSQQSPDTQSQEILPEIEQLHISAENKRQSEIETEDENPIIVVDSDSEECACAESRIITREKSELGQTF